MSVIVLSWALAWGALGQTPATDAPDRLLAPDAAEAAAADEDETKANADRDAAPVDDTTSGPRPSEPASADVEAPDADPVTVPAGASDPTVSPGTAREAKPTESGPPLVDGEKSVDAEDVPVMLELAGAFSMTSAGPATFALSDVLHVNRILYVWPEFRVGARWPRGAFGVGGEIQVGHTSVGQGNSIVGERLYLLRGAAVGIVDYRIDLHHRSVLDGVRLGLTTRLDVQGGVRALVAVSERRVLPVLSASLAAGPRVVIEWPWVNFVFDTFLGWGLDGPVSGAGLGLAFDFSI